MDVVGDVHLLQVCLLRRPLRGKGSLLPKISAWARQGTLGRNGEYFVRRTARRIALGGSVERRTPRQAKHVPRRGGIFARGRRDEFSMSRHRGRPSYITAGGSFSTSGLQPDLQDKRALRRGIEPHEGILDGGTAGYPRAEEDDDGSHQRSCGAVGCAKLLMSATDVVHIDQPARQSASKTAAQSLESDLLPSSILGARTLVMAPAWFARFRRSQTCTGAPLWRRRKEIDRGEPAVARG